MAEVPAAAPVSGFKYEPVEVEKMYPISEGTNTARKRKPHILAVILDNCTGCAG